MKRYVTIGLLVLGLILAPQFQATAARTSLWEIKDITSWLEGEFEGIGLSSDGTVQPTISTESTELPARLIWGSAPVEDGTIVGSSLPSALYKVNSDNEYEELLQTDDLGFTAIEKVNGYVYAAATPSGSIYRYQPEDDTFSKLSTLPDSYVWSMIPDQDDQGLLIGTGSNGNLYHMTLGGGYVKRASIADANITSLTTYEGKLHIGSDNGSVYRLDDGNITSVYGFNNAEVSSLAADNDYLYAAINQKEKSKQESEKQESISQLARRLKQESIQEKMTEPSTSETTFRSSKPATQEQGEAMMIQKMRQQTRSQASSLFAGLSGTMVYRMNPPGQMNVVYNDPQEIVHDLESDGENLYVATGGKGRLYKVRRDFTRVAHFKAPQTLVLNVRLDGNGRVSTITTGEGGSLFQRKDFDAENATYRSQPLDAQLMAQWGEVQHIGEGPLQIRTRSGNTETPGEYWSEWSDWSSTGNFEVSSPSARFLQFEVRFLEADAKLNKIDIAFLIPNQRPRITNFDVSSNPVRDQFLQARSTTDQNNANSSNGSRPPTDQAGERFDASTIKQRKVNWKVIDPDGDPAQTKLFYRPLDSDQWISFTGEQYIEENQYVINLQDLADGQYHLKLTATDRRFNDPGSGFATSEITGPILVDNTQPQFENFQLNSNELSFTAADQTSRVLIAQYRVNGGHWQTLWPEDRVYDQNTEDFSVTLSPDRKSGDLIEVRMLDEGGNQAIKRGTLP